MQDQQLKDSNIISEEVICKKKWFGIKQITYSIGDKIINNYQAAFRPTRKNNAIIDGVEIIPILKRKDGSKDLVLIANFRPPVGKFCLEFPAGMIETNDYQQNARRELTQETGYRAEKFVKLPKIINHCDPWKSNEGGQIFVAVIDESKQDHRSHQQLQNSENIRVIHLKIGEDMHILLNQMAEKHGYIIHQRVWCFILGLNLQKF